MTPSRRMDDEFAGTLSSHITLLSRLLTRVISDRLAAQTGERDRQSGVLSVTAFAQHAKGSPEHGRAIVLFSRDSWHLNRAFAVGYGHRPVLILRRVGVTTRLRSTDLEKVHLLE